MDLFAAGKGGDRSHLAYREVPVLTPNKGMFRFCDAAYLLHCSIRICISICGARLTS
jgi:hypothetical protein